MSSSVPSSPSGLFAEKKNTVPRLVEKLFFVVFSLLAIPWSALVSLWHEATGRCAVFDLAEVIEHTTVAICTLLSTAISTGGLSQPDVALQWSLWEVSTAFVTAKQ